MNEIISIIYSLIILSFFIIIIELTKKHHHKKHLLNQNSNIHFKTKSIVIDDEDNYKKEEFKLIFFTTLAYAIILTIILFSMNEFLLIDFNLKIYLSVNFDELTDTLKGSLSIVILNSILFAGYLIQIVMRIESLAVNDKTLLLIIKENIYGPILEEFLYRGIIFNILKAGSFSNVQASFISSLMFGLCK
jgi:membrane protease YdiL (CAAX protease family)